MNFGFSRSLGANYCHVHFCESVLGPFNTLLTYTKHKGQQISNFSTAALLLRGPLPLNIRIDALPCQLCGVDIASIVTKPATNGLQENAKP